MDDRVLLRRIGSGLIVLSVVLGLVVVLSLMFSLGEATASTPVFGHLWIVAVIPSVMLALAGMYLHWLGGKTT